jgi:hypothetical protein
MGPVPVVPSSGPIGKPAVEEQLVCRLDPELLSKWPACVTGSGPIGKPTVEEQLVCRLDPELLSKWPACVAIFLPHWHEVFVIF